MKYIIDVPEEQRHMYDEKEKVLSFLVTAKNATCNIAIDIDAKPYTEPDRNDVNSEYNIGYKAGYSDGANSFNRKDIEDEVWEFLDFLFTGMSPEERYECFDKVFSHIIVSTMSYQEAKAKYEAWKKQKDETFDTGDEVYDKEIDSKGVILRRYNSDTLDILWDDGSAGETIAIKAITKTGRHFPEVVQLLEKMRGDKGC